MNYIIFDNFRRNFLLPLTFTRPVADIRIGILTIREKWEYFLGEKTSSLTEDYLSVKYPILKADDNILINGSVIPNEKLVKEMATLDLSFSADCLEMEDLYGHTIQDIVAHPLKSFYDLKYFIGECTKPKYQHISEKIDAVDKKATLKIHFT